MFLHFAKPFPEDSHIAACYLDAQECLIWEFTVSEIPRTLFFYVSKKTEA